MFWEKTNIKIRRKKIRIRLGIGYRWFNKFSNTFNTLYHCLNHQHDLSSLRKLQHDSIYDFCHSDESSRVGSNSQRCINVTRNGEKKYPGRIWEVSTWPEKFSLFKESNAIKSYSQLHPDFKFLQSQLSIKIHAIV